VEEVKKKTVPGSLSELASPGLESYARMRYGTQDESWLGVKTLTRRRLTLTKGNPVVKVQWQVTACYWYGVVAPVTGECRMQTDDHVKTENFQQFLNAFSPQYPTDCHVIQTDKARFHCGNEWIMPANVRRLYQPPPSPQVNSAEQLWDWAKGEIAN